MGFRKKIDKSPIRKVVTTGPKSDLIADLLEALKITSSEVRERPMYIHNDESRITNGRI
jgi:hypothetical protein